MPQPLLTLPRLRPEQFEVLYKEAKLNLGESMDEIIARHDGDIGNLKGREPKAVLSRPEKVQKLLEAEADRLQLKQRILEKMTKDRIAADRKKTRHGEAAARAAAIGSVSEVEKDDDGLPKEIDGVPRETIEAAIAAQQGKPPVPPVALDGTAPAADPAAAEPAVTAEAVPPAAENAVPDTDATAAAADAAEAATDGAEDGAAAMADPAVAADPDAVAADAAADAVAAADAAKAAEDKKAEEKKTHQEAAWDAPPRIPNGSMLLADYLCDFGNVVKGHQCKRKFKLTNIGHTQLALDFSKGLLSHLAKFGITLEPVRVGKLPGYPEWESFELQITLSTAEPAVVLGQTHVLFPIYVRNAPTVCIVIRAFITLPELELSTESLDFGTLQVGTMRMLPVQLTNHKVVPVEYAFRVAASKHGLCHDLECFPPTGVLQPGEQRNIKVVLTPSSEQNLNLQLPLRMKDNPKETRIKVKAVARDITVRFDPPLLALPPLTPYSMPTEMRVRMKNDSEFPAEVIALDVDEWIIEEYNILSHLDFDATGVMHIPVRLPGEPFDEALKQKGLDIIEKERAEKERVEAEAAAAAAAAEAGEEPAAAEASGEVGELEPVAPMVVDEPDVDAAVEPEFEPNLVNILLHGASGIKKDEEGKVVAEPRKDLAIKLAERYSVKCVTIDRLIEETANSPTEIGRRVRVALGLPAELPKPEPPAEPEPAALAADADAAADGDGAPADARADGVSPEEAAAEPPMEAATEAVGEEADAVAAEVPWLRPEMCTPLEAELLVEVLAKRLKRQEYRFGVVIEGLETRYMPPDGLMETAKAVDEAMRGRHLHFMDMEIKEAEPEEEIDPKAKKPPPKAAPAKGKGAAPPVPGPLSDEDWGHAFGEFMHDHEKQEEIVAFFTPPEPPVVDEAAEAEAAEEEAAAAAAAAAEPAAADDLQPNEDEPPRELTPEEKIAAAREEFEKLSTGFRLLDPTQLPDMTKTRQHVIVEVDEQSSELLSKVLDEAGPKLTPPLPIDQKRQLPLPDIITRHVLYKPKSVFQPVGLGQFILLTPDSEGCANTPDDWATVITAEAEADAAGKPPAKAAAAPAKGKKGEPVEEEKPPEKPATRWVLLAGQSVELVVRFRAEKVGKYDQKLKFGVMGSSNEFELPCRSICAYPQISTDYRSVFSRSTKQRPDGGFVQRRYVITRQTFEFGPLLVGKTREGYDEGKCDDSKSVFLITNNGLFPLNIDFTFLNDFENKCFVLEPPSMALDIDERKNLTVWAFPPEEELYEDELICCIKENPACPTFKVSAHGQKPKIEFDTLEVAFERLLPGRAERKRVELKNVSMLKAKWTIEGIDSLEEEIAVFPTSGTLAPSQSMAVVIDFKTFDDRPPQMFDKTLSFVVRPGETLSEQDVQALQEPSQTEQLKITAESFNINTSVMLGAPDPKAAPDIEGAKQLDFGVIRVSGSAQKALTLVNNGKYDVNFKWGQKSKRAQLFKIEPKDGLLEGSLNADPKAGPKPVSVSITFDTESEVSIANFEDVKCHFYETATGEFTHSVVPTISARSVFSKYRLTPSSGINFGAMMYGTKKQRSFTITNNGEFEFTYTIADWAEVVTRPPTRETEAAADPAAKKPPDKPKAAPAKGAADALTIGAFRLSKATDVIAPGTEKVVEVEFSAENSDESKETLSVQVGIVLFGKDNTDR